jgi:hypothetical protein
VTTIAALTYWIIVAIWLTIFGTAAYFFVRNPHTFGTTRLLLIVLCIDAFRNLFENVYFGLYFGSVYGLFPRDVATVMGTPILLIVPKIVNILAGIVVLSLLLWRWLPLAIKERRRADQRVGDLETLATMDFLTGLSNRRHFETVAHAELYRNQRYMRPFSMLMLERRLPLWITGARPDQRLFRLR